MKRSRWRTFIVGTVLGVLYGLLFNLLLSTRDVLISNTYIFLIPFIIGGIPAIFSTKEQLKNYKDFILIPWISIFSFFAIAFALKMEGTICLVLILFPFFLLGTLGAFIYRAIRIKQKGNGTKLYFSLLLPLLMISGESLLKEEDQFHTVSTNIEVNAPALKVWEHIKNVENIQPEEIEPHFIHFIGVPKPLNGSLDHERIGGVRSITWEKGIQFEERITKWEPYNSFEYDIIVNPHSIPPHTLDEHVMIGGKYFDVVKGSYSIHPINENTTSITLTCTYRITTSLNFYSKIWADYLLDDFQNMILEVIQKRSENIKS